MYFDGRAIFTCPHADPEQLLDWRTHQHSLMNKLDAIKEGSQLQVIVQDWIKPGWWDTYLLDIKEKQMFQREIFMTHHEEYYWYARTLIPQNCFDLNVDFFNRLKSEPLRNLIFDNDQVQRTQLLNYPVNEQCIEYYWVKKQYPTIEGILWVRLAKFIYQKKASFYLIEILLPSLEVLS